MVLNHCEDLKKTEVGEAFFWVGACRREPHNQVFSDTSVISLERRFVFTRKITKPQICAVKPDVIRLIWNKVAGEETGFSLLQLGTFHTITICHGT